MGSENGGERPDLAACELRYVEPGVGQASEYRILEPPEPRTLADLAAVLEEAELALAVAADLGGQGETPDALRWDAQRMTEDCAKALRTVEWPAGRMIADPVRRLEMLTETIPTAAELGHSDLARVLRHVQAAHQALRAEWGGEVAA